MPYHKKYTPEQRAEAKKRNQAKWRAKNKEKQKEYSRRYYEKNRVAILARRKAKLLAAKEKKANLISSSGEDDFEVKVVLSVV